ncbi:MAG TPA: type III-B CRISPR module RAMP protein Cmr6, partial [Myxococcota bacterium]|nr:type III-B CRISPR module RAMP protein Cmr6 [Myxococcota bacterium]
DRRGNREQQHHAHGGRELVQGLTEVLGLPGPDALRALESCSNEDFLRYTAQAITFAEALQTCSRIREQEEKAAKNKDNSGKSAAPAATRASLRPKPGAAPTATPVLALRPAQFVRDNAGIRIENVALAHEKFCPPGNKESSEFIRSRLVTATPPPLYKKAFERWQKATSHEPRYRKILRFRTASRLICGTGNPAPSENGLTLHSVYGTPVLPGSSLKGVLRAWCRDHYAGTAWGDKDDQHPMGESFRLLFGDGGDTGQLGIIDFLDGLAEYRSESYFAAEIATPHYATYYQGKEAPDGFDSPNPVTFLAVDQGVTFRVVLEGDPAWLDTVAQLLTEALVGQGIGAKTRAGYGRLRQIESLDPVDEAQRLDKLTVAERLEEWWQRSSDSNPTEHSKQFLEGKAAPAGLTDLAARPDFRPAFLALLDRQGVLKKWSAGSDKERELAKKLRVELNPAPAAPVVPDEGPPFGPAIWAPERFPKGKDLNPKDFVDKLLARPFSRATVQAALLHLQSQQPKNVGAQERLKKHYGLA